MSQRKTRRRTGETIQALILNSYNEYTSLGYPKDPAVYRVRANKSTADSLRDLDSQLQYASEKPPGATFLGFLIEVKETLPADYIEFGPETVSFYWSKK